MADRKKEIALTFRSASCRMCNSVERAKQILHKGEKRGKKKHKDDKSTDGFAYCSVALVSWIAHALRHRFVVLAGCVGIAGVLFQTGYLCSKKKQKKKES